MLLSSWLVPNHVATLDGTRAAVVGTHLAGTLGAPLPSRRLDLLLQGLEPDGTDHDLGPDHVAGRAAEADGLGKLEVLFNRRLHLRARHVALEPRHVES